MTGNLNLMTRRNDGMVDGDGREGEDADPEVVCMSYRNVVNFYLLVLVLSQKFRGSLDIERTIIEEEGVDELE